MRAGIVLICFIFAASPVLGHGRSVVVPKPMPQTHLSLDLSNLHFNLFHQHDSEESAGTAGAGTNWSDQKSLSSIGVGNLHAQFGADDNPRAGLSSYKLQGMDQLGNSMWHAEQGRAAKLMFVWPTEQ